MHILTNPVIVNGKRIGPNKASQMRDEWMNHNCHCSCALCETVWQWHKHDLLLQFFGSRANAVIEDLAESRAMSRGA